MLEGAQAEVRDASVTNHSCDEPLKGLHISTTNMVPFRTMFEP